MENKENKCAIQSCDQIAKESINIYTLTGYGCCRGSNRKYSFCSNVCYEKFRNTSVCYKCGFEDRGLKYIDELGHTLCTDEDYGISCHGKYLEKEKEKYCSFCDSWDSYYDDPLKKLVLQNDDDEDNEKEEFFICNNCLDNARNKRNYSG